MGEFTHSKEQGEGTFTYADGNIYIGKWKNGKMDGLGIFLDMENKTKRQGRWKDGKRQEWITNPETINTSNSPIKRLAYQDNRIMT